MPTDFPYRQNACSKRSADACLCYEIALSCTGKPAIQDINACNGVLSLLPGPVTDDSSLACGGCEAEITIPSCVSYAVDQQSVPIEAFCQPICDTFSHDADAGQYDCHNGCQSCCIWTSTNKQASASCVCAGDVVTYTVTFTNHSPVTLDMVLISDIVPEGVTLVPDSIQPAPAPGETLQDGISMGSVPAGESVVLRYMVTVNPGAPCKIVNCACARYYYTDCRGCCQCGTGSCQSSVITLKDKCICQCVRRCFSLCGFRCLRYCYLYHRGIKHYHTAQGCISIAAFGIAMHYIDLDGEKKSRFYESSIVFHDAHCAGSSTLLYPRFTNFFYCIDCYGNVTVEFAARLCSCPDEENNHAPL